MLDRYLFWNPTKQNPVVDPLNRRLQQGFESVSLWLAAETNMEPNRYKET